MVFSRIIVVALSIYATCGAFVAVRIIRSESTEFGGADVGAAALASVVVIAACIATMPSVSVCMRILVAESIVMLVLAFLTWSYWYAINRSADGGVVSQITTYVVECSFWVILSAAVPIVYYVIVDWTRSSSWRGGTP